MFILSNPISVFAVFFLFQRFSAPVALEFFGAGTPVS